MIKVMLFEEFSADPNSGQNPPTEPTPSDIMDKPCTDCDLATKQIKTEIKRVDKIRAKKKNETI